MMNTKLDTTGRRLSIGCVLLIGGAAVQCGQAVGTEAPSTGGASAGGGSGNAPGGHSSNEASGGFTVVGLPTRGGSSNDGECVEHPVMAAGSGGEVWCNPGVPPR